ncbi:MAG: DUF2849 domain-containing protein [Alphaproteobacteria bacterium]|nr:DUF2849 domain-containing protein [Alphaproteobacteria bacterium]
MDGTPKKAAAAEATGAVELQVLTAYRLTDGVVIYLDAKGGWTEWVEEARVSRTKDDADAMTVLAKAGEAAHQVFETYLIPVSTDGDRTWPVSMREVMRAQGPTIHPQFGKQAMRAGRIDATAHAGSKRTGRGERKENREG